MQGISINDLLRLTEESINEDQPCSILFSTYLAWSRLDPDFEKNLELIGVLLGKSEEIEEIYVDHGPNNYWSPSFPIDIRFYPYAGCDIYKHIQTGCYFLLYTELGGHGAEKRCRLVQRSLISII